MSYERLKAVNYAITWWNSRNPRFFDFDLIGGDCTNFISQCLFYGGIEMNKDWYYKSLNDRSPSWSGVNEFCSTALNNNSLNGVKAKLCSINEVEVGDIVQLMEIGHNVFHHEYF